MVRRLNDPDNKLLPVLPQNPNVLPPVRQSPFIDRSSDPFSPGISNRPGRSYFYDDQNIGGYDFLSDAYGNTVGAGGRAGDGGGAGLTGREMGVDQNIGGYDMLSDAYGNGVSHSDIASWERDLLPPEGGFQGDPNSPLQTGVAQFRTEPDTGWASLTDMQQAQMGSSMGGTAGRMIASLFHKKPKELLKTYQRLREAYANLDDPNVLKQVWDAPVIQQIARFSPELVRGLQEDISQYDVPETDEGIRAKQLESLARIEERATRGDPIAQRIQTQEASNAMARSFGRAGTTAQALAARRGMPGGGVTGRDMIQGGADLASRIGTSAVLAGRKDMATAEARAFTGATGIRQADDLMKNRAATIRNTFRNAMANRQKAVAISNQKVRQQASDQNQILAQNLHQTNVQAADQRRIGNQRQRNEWERERYRFDRQRLDDDATLQAAIARERDQATRDRNRGLTDTIGGAFSMAGGIYGLS